MISIIIPTMTDNVKYATLCTDSLEKNTMKFAFEIILAPNGRGTDELQGQCAAVNKAVEKAKGDWIMLSNDDMYYAPGWDKNFYPVEDCFSPNLVEPTDNAGSAPPFLKLDAGFTIDKFKPEIVDKFVGEFNENTIENGFNLPFFIKKDLWKKIHGYDEMYDPWGSNGDSDLQYKIELAGIQPKRHRGMLVYHFSNKSGTFKPENQTYWSRNFEYFKEKWGFERVGSPEVWYHDIKIDLNKLKFNPEWSRYRRYE